MKMADEKRALYATLRSDIAAGGARALVLSPPDEWPQVFSVVRDADVARVRVYLWNLTADSARGDYKFQLTGVDGNQFQFEPDVRTIILGYYDSLRLYLAADAEHRTAPFGSSPAIQTTQEHLNDANSSGLKAFEKRGTGEIAIVVRCDVLATYLLEAQALHEIGRRASGVQDVNQIAGQIGAPVAPPVLVARDRATVTVLRAIRSANFARRVLSAYAHCCCICGVQLELVEAAHIVPAGASMSSDDTRNGLALCALHHTAYDSGLLGIHPDYTVSISRARVARLTAASRDAGLATFQSVLRPSIALPYDRANHPDPNLLKRGLEARDWPG